MWKEPVADSCIVLLLLTIRHRQVPFNSPFVKPQCFPTSTLLVMQLKLGFGGSLHSCYFLQAGEKQDIESHVYWQHACYWRLGYRMWLRYKPEPGGDLGGYSPGKPPAYLLCLSCGGDDLRKRETRMLPHSPVTSRMLRRVAGRQPSE